MLINVRSTWGQLRVILIQLELVSISALLNAHHWAWSDNVSYCSMSFNETEWNRNSRNISHWDHHIIQSVFMNSKQIYKNVNIIINDPYSHLFDVEVGVGLNVGLCVEGNGGAGGWAHVKIFFANIECLHYCSLCSWVVNRGWAFLIVPLFAAMGLQAVSQWYLCSFPNSL